MRAILCMAAAVVAATILSAGGRAETVGGSWIGPLQGSNAFVAIVSDGDQLVAYVCDNGTVGSWFFSSDGGQGSRRLVGKDGSVLEFTLGARARGTFTKGGRTSSFEARATDKDVLFRADAVAGDTTVLAGWIQNGNESRGTATIGSLLQPAPALTTNVSLTVNATLLLLQPAPMTPDSLSSSTTNTTKFVWGALGDSYASGEGNPEHGIANPSDINSFTDLRWGDDTSIFVPDGYSLRSDVTTCHRSDRAGAPKANTQLEGLYSGMSFALGFVACSGATASALMSAGYQGPDLTNNDAHLGFIRVPQPAQLDRIATFASDQGQLDALYMSIGGNNVGFGDIVTDCLTPFTNCADKDSGMLSQNLAALATTYNTLDTSIEQHFPDAKPPVLISDYPNPLDRGPGLEPCHGDDYNAFGDVGLGGYDAMLKGEVSLGEAQWAETVPDAMNSVILTAAINNDWDVISAHTNAFLGHGICTSNPFINLNSAALHRQGHDLGGLLNFSAGLMHPNDPGYAAYGDAITGALRQYVDARAKTTLVAPSNVRIATATANGPITLRWNDRSASENGDDVEVLPARTQDAALITIPSGATPIAGGGFRIRVSGVGAQQFVHLVNGGGRFLYRVRACQSGIVGSGSTECGPFSAQITGTNVAPAAPTNVHMVMTTSTGINNRIVFQNTLQWNAQPDAIEFAVRVENADGTSSEGRTSSTAFGIATITTGMTLRVAACNRVGCSGYTTISG
jgi:hypothetical protein